MEDEKGEACNTLGEMRNACRIFVGILEVKRALGRCGLNSCGSE
jgi:hypothetical protein